MDYEKKLKNALSDKSVPFEVQAWLKEQFSELKESEDKDILNAIAEGVQNCEKEFGWSDFGGVPIDDILAWIEKQGEQTLSQTDERDWLYLICDVLTWKDGIGQYLDDPRVQELAKKLRNEYAQKLTKQKPAENAEPNFSVGDWVVNEFGDVWHIDSFDKKNYQVSNGNEHNYFPISKQNEMHPWAITDAKNGDLIVCEDFGYTSFLLFKSFSNGRISLHCWYNSQTNNFHLNKNVALRKDANIHPASKEQRAIFFAKMKDAGCEWDAEKKELKKIMED